METTLLCWGYIGIMEKKMEATILETDASLMLGTVRIPDPCCLEDICSGLCPHRQEAVRHVGIAQ